MSTTFEAVIARFDWKAIRNCPGRHILTGGRTAMTIDEIVGTPIEIFRVKSDVVPDEILIARLENGGGLISYAKDDGRFLHTLNDEDGFRRKLATFGID